VDAQKFCRVEAAFQFRDGLIHRVAAVVRHGIRQLVLGYKMGDGVQLDE